MDKKPIIEIISKFKDALRNNGISIDKIILYGSWVKNTQKDGSDIDLVVISKDFQGKSYWERQDLLSNAIYAIFEPIEAIAITPKEYQSNAFNTVDLIQEGSIEYKP
ncbi:nucleotidyltransferase domain-containing protein [bacterium]|nr:nucleotidyltransferase domain-containing protein [bacterium]